MLRQAAIYLTVWEIIRGVFTLGPNLLVIVVVMWPFAVNLVFAVMWRRAASQALLIVVPAAYGIWYRMVWADIQKHMDPQSGIMILFIGIYAFPVLALLWGIGGYLESKRKPESSADESP